MDYQQKLGELMSSGHYKLNSLLDGTKEKLYDISTKYEISPNVIIDGCLESDEDSDQNLGVNNTCTLLANPNVRRMILGAKTDIFSSSAKYSQFISSLSEEITGYFSGEEDFSLITNFSNMRSQLDSYVRNGNMTKHSRNIRANLVPLLGEFKDDLESREITFHLLGSIRYGDANEYSDVDTNLISLSVEPKQHEDNVFFKNNLEGAIDDNLMPNQVRDGISIIDISQYQAILRDILDGETDCEEDYYYSCGHLLGYNDLFHPYDWLLQGENPLCSDLKIDREIAETKTMIAEAATKDPLFEFILCYKMMFSIQKRHDNLCRE